MGSFDLERIGALGHNDWSAGYMRRETYWNWACLAGRLRNGKRIGLNVSCGVNETSFTENCFWINGRLYKLDMVHFEYDRSNIFSPWWIRSNDGKLDLEFHPSGKHSETINAFIVASNFHQLFGRFYGKVKLSRWRSAKINGLYGYTEDHYAKW